MAFKRQAADLVDNDGVNRYHRIFDVAELRLGTRKQQSVRINRVAEGNDARKDRRS